MGIFGNLFSSSNSSIIDSAIDHMSKEPSTMGTAYREISYKDVVKYIDERGCRVQRTEDKGDHTWYDFVAIVNGKSHEVWLGKTPDGGGSIITVPPK